MLLESVNFRNFRQFKGDQKIDFAIDKKNNVTVILGQNTGGKTTFVQAFIWCLYGKNTFADKELMNIEVLQDFQNKPSGVEREVAVSIQLMHNDRRYIFTRSKKYVKRQVGKSAIDNFVVLESNDAGGMIPIQDDKKESKINEILPAELSEYFFFWGERIENLGTKRNLTNAVRNFLGLSVIDNARKHLKNVKTDFTKELSGSIEDSKTSKRLHQNNERLDQIDRDLPKLAKKKEDAKENEVYFKNKVDELNRQLETNRSSSEAQERIEEYKEKQQQFEERVEGDYKKILSEFNKHGFMILTDKFRYALLETLDAATKEEVGYLYQSVNSIEEILNKGICLCGCNLNENPEAKQHIKDELNKIPPRSIYTATHDFKRSINKNIDEVKEFAENFRGYVNRYRDDTDYVEDYRNRIQDEIKKIDKNVDTKELRIQRDKANEDERKYIQKEAKISNEIETLHKEKTKLENENIRLANVSESNEKIRKYIAYTEAVIQDINKDYDDKEKSIQKRINELVNEYFTKMYHGDRKAYVDENYKVIAYIDNGGKKLSTEESPGLQTVKNFAFIAALVEIAKEKRNNKKEDDQMNIEPYPLVLDAPFSAADEVHVPNICDLISQVAEQTILVVMEKDWNYAKKSMEDRVGSFYRLHKVSETNTKIEKI